VKGGRRKPRVKRPASTFEEIYEASFEQIFEELRVAYTGLTVVDHCVTADEAANPGPEVELTAGQIVQVGTLKQPTDKSALMDIILVCAGWQRPLPPWARQVLERTYEQGINGNLESWDDVFGKPYQQFETQKHASERLRQRLIRRAMSGRKREQASFDAVAEEFGIGRPRQDEAGFTGGSTVRNLLYKKVRRQNPSGKAP
jgi:hypothetical protein